MLYLMRYFRDRLCYLLDLDERGIETLEWVLIGGIVAGVAAITYAVLQGGLTGSVNKITTFIDGQMP